MGMMRVMRVMLGLALLVGCFSGCAYVRVYDKEKQVGFSSMMPAWPWQDSTAVIDRVQFSAKTNTFTASVRGLNETEVTNTNSAALVQAVTQGAIEGALKALVPK
jgi:hypothetical protein